jgi:hypothetical protein
MYKKLTNCKYCNISFDDLNASERANHSRWCDLNPKRKDYVNSLKTRNRNYIICDENRIKRNKKISDVWKRGAYSNVDFATLNKGKNHSDETKEKMREKALQSNHRRLKKNTILYKGVLLDSTWEFELAKRLDELSVKWIRPEPIPWTDKQGRIHNYFPDFYLPEHDLFIDPKNKHAANVQKDKIKILLSSYKNIIFLHSLEECKNFSICQHRQYTRA